MENGMIPQEYGFASKPGPWVEEASCRGIDGDMFYPELYTNEIVAAAKRVCSLCPVKDECLEHAMVNREIFGIWGGTTELERNRMWRRNLRKEAFLRAGITR